MPSLYLVITGGQGFFQGVYVVSAHYPDTAPHDLALNLGHHHLSVAVEEGVRYAAVKHEDRSLLNI